MGSMSITVKEHSKQLCDKLQSLRSDTNLVDLDLVCEDAHLHVHKVVMAASSKFFKEQLCKSASTRGPLILKIEDFNMKLKREAVSYLVEFIYKGEVVIPADLLSPVCEAAHSLGVHGLTEFLPAPAKKATPPRVQESSTQIDDSFGNSSNNASADINAHQGNDNPASQAANQQIVHQWPSSEVPSAQFVNPSSMDFFQSAPEVVQHQTFQGYPNQMNASQYKPFYGSYQESNFNNANNEETTIIDLDSNSMDGVQVEDQPQENERNVQPKGRLRIINQPDGPMTENIHDLKSQNQQEANLETHSSNNFINWIPNFDQQQQQQASFEVENSNSLWYNNFNYNEEGSSWTTPAASTSTASTSYEPPLPSLSSDLESIDQNQIQVNDKSIAQKNKEASRKGQEEIKLRPPPPLLAKGSSPRTKVAVKRPELEVRKDLTLPTAPTAREDNVFQAEEDLPIVLDEDEAENNDDAERNSAGTSESNSFKCLQCSMVFSSDAQLRSHTRHTHKQEDTLLFCPVCKTAILHGLENLKVHLYKSHGIGEVFRCEECNFETSVKSNYVKHLNTHSEMMPKKLRMCNKCGKAFKSRCGLKLHLQTHDSEDLHHCSFCDFRTPQKVNLIKHLAVKHKKDEHGEELKMNKTCPLCPFKCVADHILKSHMLRKHTSKEKMKYQCSQCEYATVEAAALKKHIRFKHTNERPFMCSVCGFSTHTHSAMARHKRGHEQSKPYVCPTCGMAYADRKRLRDHEAMHQSGNVPLPYDCDFCGYSTRRKDNLQAHIKRQHPDLATKNVKSHIIGHVNEDGSIRPINSNDSVPNGN